MSAAHSALHFSEPRSWLPANRKPGRLDAQGAGQAAPSRQARGTPWIPRLSPPPAQKLAAVISCTSAERSACAHPPLARLSGEPEQA
eukprot:scaffold128374_cov63-Phaeocystis_antarctica.AAC.1